MAKGLFPRVIAAYKVAQFKEEYRGWGYSTDSRQQRAQEHMEIGSSHGS